MILRRRDLERFLGAIGLDQFGESERQFAQARAGHRRDLEYAISPRLELGAHEVGELVPLGNVDLVERDELRALEERELALRNRIRRELGAG